MKPSTLTQYQRLLIESNCDTISELRSFKKISPFLKSLGIIISQEELHSILNPDTYAYCDKASFISYSVGFRACSKGCECYVANLSSKISKIKTEYDIDKKKEIRDRREDTNILRYGVSNVAALPTNTDKIKNTKFLKYGSTSYNNREKSSSTSLSKYGVDNPAKSPEISAKTKLTNLRVYGNEYPIQTKEISSKIIASNLEKFGSESPFGNSEILAKCRSTALARYGTENPAKSNEIKDKISINLRSSIYDRMIIDYADRVNFLFSKEEYIAGINYPMQCSVCNSTLDNPILNGIVQRCIICNPYSVSMFEKEVRKFIEDNYSGILEFNRRNIISPKELDIFIPELSLAIECNGIYRHTEVSGNKPRSYHLDKTQACIKNNISLFHITDIQWYNQQNIVKSMILNKLKKSTRIYARNCSVQRISDKSIINSFLDKSHLQGRSAYSVAYGLYKDNVLIAVMTFGKPRYSDNQYELLRFCNMAGTTVVGGANKLLSAFIKNCSPNNILSYCNRSFGVSSFYETLGFTFSHASPPGYSYFKSGEIFNRLKFQKHKLEKVLPIFDKSETEWTNMKNNGYDRIWDCGNTVWIWDSSTNIHI